MGIDVYTYDHEGELQASAMPELRQNSELINYKRRFEYLLINVSEIHNPEQSERRKEIWNLYPDTTKLKQLYLKEYIKDEKLTNYFEITEAAINDTSIAVTSSFNEEELMEVASKFFYCDKVFLDTTVQSHVCVGLNGVSEANWSKDYTLIEAFCYEAIFDDLVSDTSQIHAAYSTEKKEACNQYKATMTSLDEYLIEVRIELFERMKNDAVLRVKLLEYYHKNRNNLAFEII